MKLRHRIDMWYIKDHLGRETGPFSFDELNSQLSRPALRENATLIKSGDHGLWKPALIALPALFDDQLPGAGEATPDPSQPIAGLPLQSRNPKSSPNQQEMVSTTDTKLTIVAKDLNRMRPFMGFLGFYSLLLLYEAVSRVNIQHLATDLPPLESGDVMMVCTILFLFPISVLVKVVKAKTNASMDSVQATIKLHRRLWSTIFAVSTVLVILLLIAYLTG